MGKAAGLRAGLVALAACLALSGCGTGERSGLERLGAALIQTAKTPDPGASKITATRASLTAAGFSDPLIVAAIPKADTRGGLLLSARKNGVSIWTAADGGSTLQLHAGVLRSTTGFGHDLYAAQTGPVVAAIAKGQTARYSRVLRHLDGVFEIRQSVLSCVLTPQGPETIVVFDRAHATLRLAETCAFQGGPERGPDGGSEITNLYWRDAKDTTLWRSRQWIGPDLGEVVIERVFR